MTATIYQRLEETQCSEEDAHKVAAKCRMDWDLTALPPYEDYAHGSLCVIDAVWSIGARYAAVENVVKRYCEYRNIQPVHGPEDSIEALACCADNNYAGLVGAFANRQRTSPIGGILKSEAVIAVAQRLVAAGVKTRGDLFQLGHAERTCAAWTGVTGQGSGISFIYGRMLAGVEDVKPDRMICRFIGDVLDRPITDAYQARAIMRRAWIMLKEGGWPNLSLRALDHEIWKARD